MREENSGNSAQIVEEEKKDLPNDDTSEKVNEEIKSIENHHP
jgi:hypothetical protein